MFNRELKEAYIATRKGGMVKQYTWIFKRSQPIEEELGKDVALFSADEYAQFVEQFGNSEPDVLRSRQGMVAVYADWFCEQQGIPGHEIRKYDTDTFPYAKHLAPLIVKSPEELINKILQVYDIDSGQPAIAGMCLAWLGISLGEAVQLRKEQVDTRYGKIYDATGNIVVQQMPDIIRETLDAYGKTYRATRTQNQTFTVYAEDMGYFIKRMRTQNSQKPKTAISTTQMSGWITEFRDLYVSRFGHDAPELSFTNVQRSGNFYRLHAMAKSGVDVRDIKNADKVRLCLGSSKRYHKDNMLMYDAYLEVIGEK